MENLLVRSAKEFARVAHGGQMRTNSNEPYFNHCCRVAQTLSTHGFSNELIAAAFLHDTVEDTSITIEDIEVHFGKRVASYVAFNTENKNHTWEQRKEHTIQSMKRATLEEKALVVADKLDNLTSFAKQYKIDGESMWVHYHRGRKEQRLYYEGVCDSMWQGVSTHLAPSYFHTFEQLVNRFFRGQGKDAFKH